MSTRFEHSFLDTLFWNEAKAKGVKRPPDSLEHEGHEITRHAFPQKSNSGKSTSRWSVSFRVTTPDGGVYSVDDPVEPNRRNDPNRNWGLGRD